MHGTVKQLNMRQTESCGFQCKAFRAARCVDRRLMLRQGERGLWPIPREKGAAAQFCSALPR